MNRASVVLGSLLLGAASAKSVASFQPLQKHLFRSTSLLSRGPEGRARQRRRTYSTMASVSGGTDTAPTVRDASSAPAPSNVLQFLRLVGQLKRLKRTGWLNSGITLPESVSDHMYRMAMCSFLITDPTIDRSRLMKLAVVHDLAEAVVGDIVPNDTRYTKEDKRRLEETALRKICEELDHQQIGDELVSLWLEYEDGLSREALVVKDFDKFEMIVQADEYERDQGMMLESFFKSTAGYFQTPQVKEWDKELRRQRDSRLEKQQPQKSEGGTEL